MFAMSKRARQYIGIISAIVSYYVVHEGAHLIYALISGSFKKINFMGLGIQIDVFNERMTDIQIGIFCLLGTLATLVCGYILVGLTGKICKSRNKVFMAVTYYITLTMLILDPVYLSILCSFFGGGDMNGIALLVPEAAARIVAGIVFTVNIIIFIKAVIPRYKKAFKICKRD